MSERSGIACAFRSTRPVNKGPSAAAGPAHSRAARRVGYSPDEIERLVRVCKEPYATDETRSSAVLKLFSVDDHIIEPPTVWRDRVPAPLPGGRPARRRGRRPRVLGVRGPPGRDDGPERRRRQGARRVQAGPRPLRRHDPRLLRPGRAGQGHARRRDPRQRPVPDAAPLRRHAVPAVRRHGRSPTSACRRTTTSSSRSGARPARPACSSRRSSASCGIRSWAAAEIRRCADLGARALSFPENPVPLGLAVVLDRPLGSGVAGRARTRHRAVPAHRHQRRRHRMPSPEAPDVADVLDAAGRLDHVVGQPDDEPGLPAASRASSSCSPRAASAGCPSRSSGPTGCGCATRLQRAR